MRNITVLAGGNGGARLVTSLLSAISSETLPGIDNETRLSVVANTADDLWLHGLKVCPDLDTLMLAVRPGERTSRDGDAATPSGTPSGTHTVRDELLAYGVEPNWYEFTDREVGTHLVRTQMMEAGYPLSAVTAAMTQRWNGDVTLLPMTDDRVETHVAVADAESPSGRRVVHLQEYRRALGGAVPAEAVITVGLDQSSPAPGVLDAITEADLVLLAPCDPIASIGPLVGVPGVREALRSTRARVVGLSPVVGSRGVGAPSRDDSSLLQLLRSSATAPSAAAVGLRHGARSAGGVLDAWLIDASDANGDTVQSLEAAGLIVLTAPLGSAAPADLATVLRTALEGNH